MLQVRRVAMQKSLMGAQAIWQSSQKLSHKSLLLLRRCSLLLLLIGIEFLSPLGHRKVAAFPCL